MFQAVEKIIDDIKYSTGNALRLSTLAAAAGVSLLITSGFLTAALFVFVQQRQGTVAACLTASAVFFVIAMIAVGAYVAHQRKTERLLAEAKRKAEQAAKAAAAATPPASAIFTDPAMIAIGFQVLRAVGMRRLIPLLAIGGVAAGFFASRRGNAPKDPPADHLDGEA